MTCILKTYKEPLVKSIAFAISYVSLVGSVFPFKDWPTLTTFLVLVSLLALVVVVWMEFRWGPKRRVYLQKDKEEIQNYMFDWIKKGRHTAIFSHNLTWVSGNRIRQLLESKAQAKELTVYVPNEEDLTSEAKSLISVLRKNGAAIHVYAKCASVPMSRFTIINLNGPGERVAVAHGHGEFHIIEEYSANEHPAFYMAKDLLELARNLATPNA